MLAAFETRLTEVLGSRLQAPFAGRVIRRGDPAPGGAGPVIQLGVDSAEPLDPELASVRPEVVPGSAALRRVVRMRAVVGFDVVPTSTGGRAQRVLGVDRLIYELEDPDIRSLARPLVSRNDRIADRDDVPALVQLEVRVTDSDVAGAHGRCSRFGEVLYSTFGS